MEILRVEMDFRKCENITDGILRTVIYGYRYEEMDEDLRYEIFVKKHIDKKPWTIEKKRVYHHTKFRKYAEKMTEMISDMKKSQLKYIEQGEKNIKIKIKSHDREITTEPIECKRDTYNLMKNSLRHCEKQYNLV